MGGAVSYSLKESKKKKQNEGIKLFTRNNFMIFNNVYTKKMSNIWSIYHNTCLYTFNSYFRLG